MDVNEGRALGYDFADLGGGDLAALKFGAEGGGVFWGDGDEEAAGCLRVEEEGAGIFVNIRGKFDAACDEFAIAFKAAGEKAAASRIARAGEQGDLRVVDAQGNGAARGHLARVAEKAEAGDVGDGVNGRVIVRGLLDFMQNFGGIAIEARHRGDGGFDGGGRSLPYLERRGDDAGADRFGEN